MSSTIVGELVYKIVGDTSKFNTALRDSNNIVNQFVRSRTLVQLGNQLSGVGREFDKLKTGSKSTLTQMTIATDTWIKNHVTALEQGVSANSDYIDSVNSIRDTWGSAVAQGDGFFTMLTQTSGLLSEMRGEVHTLKEEMEGLSTVQVPSGWGNTAQQVVQNAPVGDVLGMTASEDILTHMPVPKSSIMGGSISRFFFDIVIGTGGIIGFSLGGVPGSVFGSAVAGSVVNGVSSAVNSQKSIIEPITVDASLGELGKEYGLIQARINNEGADKELSDQRTFLMNSIGSVLSQTSSIYNKNQDERNGLKAILESLDKVDKNLAGLEIKANRDGSISSSSAGDLNPIKDDFLDVKNILTSLGMKSIWDSWIEASVPDGETVSFPVALTSELIIPDGTFVSALGDVKSLMQFSSNLRGVTRDGLAKIENGANQKAEVAANLIHTGVLSEDTVFSYIDRDFADLVTTSRRLLSEKNQVENTLSTDEAIASQADDSVMKWLRIWESSAGTIQSEYDSILSMPEEPIALPATVEIDTDEAKQQIESVVEGLEPARDSKALISLNSMIAGHQSNIDTIESAKLSDTEQLELRRQADFDQVTQAKLSGIINVDEAKAAMDTIEESYNQMLQDMEDAEKPSWEDWTKEALNSFTQIAGEVDKLVQAVTQSKIAALESQMQAELEAMGLVEEQEKNKHTKSREAKAENLIEIQKNLAKETDIQKRNELMQRENEEKEALDKLIKEEEDEEKRLVIQEKYEKEMAQVKYKAALFSWNVQKVQAIAGTAQAVINTMATTPFPLNLAMVPITMAIGALQLATLYANKPEPPAFALGALEIPQDMQATIHQGEMILPRPFAEDVRQGNIAIGETGGGVGGSHVKVEIYANDSVETEEVQDGDMTKLKVFVGKAWLDAYKKGQFDNPLMSRHGIKKRGIR